MKIKFLTLGCKVNQYETQALKEECAKYGFQQTNGIADIYVVNTCTVTAKADAKSREAILRAKRANPKAKIVVSGCLAQLPSNRLSGLKVDYVIPQEKKYLLSGIIAPLNGKVYTDEPLSKMQKN
ncbi:MAG: hypothetical protein PHQ96_09690, partial [Candidatus Omnitrophica bacterium]|nr:hypothetical protein [Candidatus Omnitrophota bacterium]